MPKVIAGSTACAKVIMQSSFIFIVGCTMRAQGMGTAEHTYGHGW